MQVGPHDAGKLLRVAASPFIEQIIDHVKAECVPLKEMNDNRTQSAHRNSDAKHSMVEKARGNPHHGSIRARIKHTLARERAYKSILVLLEHVKIRNQLVPALEDLELHFDANRLIPTHGVDIFEFRVNYPGFEEPDNLIPLRGPIVA